MTLPIIGEHVVKPPSAGLCKTEPGEASVGADPSVVHVDESSLVGNNSTNGSSWADTPTRSARTIDSHCPVYPKRIPADIPYLYDYSE